MLKVEFETKIWSFDYFSEQDMFICNIVHLQTSQRLFSKQGALIKFVNGSMMESTETQYATANQMSVTQLKLWRVGYKMGVQASFTSLFSSQCSVWHCQLWSFKTRDTKVERFLHKNQHSQRKSLNFENWTHGEPQNLSFLS